MKVVILAGGLGTRISEESHLKPKPMIEIGGQPILWHVMKCFQKYGYNEFIICAGYKQQIIKEYFSHYYLHHNNITFDFTKENKKVYYNANIEPWKVTVVDTGLNTMTGGRVKRIKDYVGNEPFLLTYGDGICDVNIDELVNFHNKSKKTVTLTAVQPAARFGILDIDSNGDVNRFSEKAKEDVNWINGGYMVVEPNIFDYIEGDSTTLEREPLETLSREGQLNAFKHHGFWQCMDTQRDKTILEEQYSNGKAVWKWWKD